MRYPIHSLLVSLLMSVALVACGDKSDDPSPTIDPPTTDVPLSRTVLVYMVADNSLGTRFGCDEADLQEMLTAVKAGALNGGRLLVYHNRPNTSATNPPQLLDVTASGLNVLKNYTYAADGESVTPERIREVMADMKAVAPADDYGLVLWSHSNNWLGPVSTSDKYYRAFGEDSGYHIKVQTLAQTLAGEKFSFIYFDCCLMGNVEVAYEMRSLAPVIIASPTELCISGMPYDRNVPVMFSSKLTDEERAVKMAQNTFGFYDHHDCGDPNCQDGPYCQMTVVRTSALDGFAKATKSIFENVTDYFAGLSRLQEYDKNTSSSYDMDNYMEMLTADGQEELYAKWCDELDKVVIYHATTDYCLTGTYMSRYCGLGSYVVYSPSKISYRGYNTLKWWDDVVSAAPAYN